MTCIVWRVPTTSASHTAGVMARARRDRGSTKRDGGAAAAASSVELTSTPEELRQAGNAAFERGDFAEVTRIYSTWLAKEVNNEVAYSNRSHARVALASESGTG